MKKLLRSILYFSRSLILSPNRPVIADLVQQSRSWNRSVGITGALVSTEQNFVQFIEGPDAAIADLLGKIFADGRHTQINVIEDTRTGPPL